MPLQFEKGKPGIVVGPRDKLPAVTDVVIAATRSGELDALLEQPKAASRSLMATTKPA
jgi:hypothetical protein